MADVSRKLRLRIVTPTKIVYDDDVYMVVMKTIEGEIGVLAGHEPLTTVLDYGKLRLTQDDEKWQPFAVFGGFAEINRQGATILADVAEHPEEIDAARAKAAKERAERRIKEKKSDLDEARAKSALRKALVRLELGGLPMTDAHSK
jgi:F-type H+-transporting ATPase subunit epsilon